MHKSRNHKPVDEHLNSIAAGNTIFGTQAPASGNSGYIGLQSPDFLETSALKPQGPRDTPPPHGTPGPRPPESNHVPRTPFFGACGALNDPSETVLFITGHRSLRS